MTMIRMGGQWIDSRPIAENLTRSSAVAADRQDGIAAVWTWFWRKQVNQGNLLAFKARRAARYSLAMTLYDAPTTALADAAEVRIVVYHADQETMKKILWKGTYGTIKNGSKYNIEQMLHVTQDYDIQPGEWLRFEVYHASETLDESASTEDIGCSRWVPL